MAHRASQRNAGEAAVVGMIAWRRRRLEHAGFDGALAERLASDRRFDLHAVLELIDHGCPPGLAARILAPIDDPPQRSA